MGSTHRTLGFRDSCTTVSSHRSVLSWGGGWTFEPERISFGKNRRSPCFIGLNVSPTLPALCRSKANSIAFSPKSTAAGALKMPGTLLRFKTSRWGERLARPGTEPGGTKDRASAYGPGSTPATCRRGPALTNPGTPPIGRRL